MLLLRDKVQQ